MSCTGCLTPESGRVVAVAELAVVGVHPAPAELLAVTESAWRGALRRFVRHRAALAGAIVLLLITAAAILAPLLVQDPINAALLAARTGPSDAHLLGTDTIGRDVLARVVYGARVSLTVSVLA